MGRNLNGVGAILRLDDAISVLCRFCHRRLPSVVVQQYNGSAKGLFLATLQLPIGLGGRRLCPLPAAGEGPLGGLLCAPAPVLRAWAAFLGAFNLGLLHLRRCRPSLRREPRMRTLPLGIKLSGECRHYW